MRAAPQTGVTLRSQSPVPWPVEEWLERESAKYPISRARAREVVDCSNLTYSEPLDENLVCPICKVPLVAPVTTPCDHTFCFECIKQCCDTSTVCPVDRKPFRPKQMKPASRLLRNQLDSLRVLCPNTERGCTEKIRREDVVMHAHHCEYGMAPCPDHACHKTVVRWLLADSKCLHYDESCSYCDATVEAAAMHQHTNVECPQNQTDCGHCGESIRKSDLTAHQSTACPDSEAGCEYAEYGCAHRAKRKVLAEHEESCPYKACSVIGQTVKLQQRQIERLQRENEDRDRLIWELKRELQHGPPWDDDFRLHPHGPKYRTAEEAVMGIYEEAERRIKEVKKHVTELEGRQTMMVLNEVLPIKNEITETRSNLGVLKMHVAWLMNKSREEVERNRLANRAVGGAAAAAAAVAAGASASTGHGRGSSDTEAERSSTSRRLSDGSNGIPRL